MDTEKSGAANEKDATKHQTGSATGKNGSTSSGQKKVRTLVHFTIPSLGPSKVQTEMGSQEHKQLDDSYNTDMGDFGMEMEGSGMTGDTEALKELNALATPESLAAIPEVELGA